MTPDAPRQLSCRCSLVRRNPDFYSPLLFLWFLFPTATLAQPQLSPDDGLSKRQNDNSPPPQSSSGSSSDNGDSGSHLSRDGLLNLYFLFIAIAVIMLLAALFFLNKRKKRKKEMMRNFGQSALAQDINGDGAGNSRTGRWIHGNRWAAPHQTGGPARMEEGLNERGEAPPPYYQQPGGPPPPVGAHVVAGSAPHPVGPNGQAMPPPGGYYGGDVGLAIPMRTLSRDAQGSKPPEYQDALRPGSGHDVMGGPNITSASSSTGNLLRHDGHTRQ